MHGVKTPLFQFCNLAREGKISSEEINRMIKTKTGSDKKDLSKKFDEIIQSAREAAEQSVDPNVRASSLVVIAGFSQKDKDIEMALNGAFQITNGFRDQILAALVKTLAKAHRFDKAWEVARRIENDYWATMAILFIACITDSPQDFERARSSAKRLKNNIFKKEALADIEDAQQHKHLRRKILKNASSRRKKTEAIDKLIHALIRLNDFDTAHEVALEINSATCRLDVLESIAKALSQIVSSQ